MQARRESRLRRSFRADDPAVVHVSDTVGKIKDATVVRYNNDGASGAHGDLGKQIHGGAAGFMIESRGGLIADDQTRLMHQRTGQRDTLLLTAG